MCRAGRLVRASSFARATPTCGFNAAEIGGTIGPQVALGVLAHAEQTLELECNRTRRSDRHLTTIPHTLPAAPPHASAGATVGTFFVNSAASLSCFGCRSKITRAGR